MPSDEHLAVIRHEAQLFDAAHTGFGRMGETPIREIKKAALKDSQADGHQGIDCHEKANGHFNGYSPCYHKVALQAGLTGSQPRSTRLQTRHAGPSGISSVQTRKLERVLGPNVVVIATSAASRPRASNTLPIRGTLLRASNVYHCPPRKASNHAAKSPGGKGGGVPMSPRYPVQ